MASCCGLNPWALGQVSASAACLIGSDLEGPIACPVHGREIQSGAMLNHPDTQSANVPLNIIVNQGMNVMA